MFSIDLDKFWISLYNDLSNFYYDEKGPNKVLKETNKIYNTYSNTVSQIDRKLRHDLDIFGVSQHLNMFLTYKEYRNRELPAELKARCQKMLEMIEEIRNKRMREAVVAVDRLCYI